MEQSVNRVTGTGGATVLKTGGEGASERKKLTSHLLDTWGYETESHRFHYCNYDVLPAATRPGSTRLHGSELVRSFPHRKLKDDLTDQHVTLRWMRITVIMIILLTCHNRCTNDSGLPRFTRSLNPSVRSRKIFNL